MRELKIAYFAASCDDAEKNTEFAKSLELDYPILSDPGKKVAQAYGVVSKTRPFPQRWTFFIGKDGKVLYIDKTVKTATHGADIGNKMKELGASGTD